MESRGSYSGNGTKIRREKDMFSNYKRIDAFPASGQSQVYLVKSKHDGKYYALKYSNGSVMRDEDQGDRIKSEAFLLNHLSHPNIIKVVDFFETNHHGFCSVMEYSKCYTLQELVEDCEKISDEEVEFAKEMYDVHGGELYLKENVIVNIVGQIAAAFLFLNS